MADNSAEIARTLARGRRRRGRGLGWALGLLVVGGAVLWLMWPGTNQQVGYQTEPVTRGDLVITVTATGTVQPTTEVDVSSELSGTLATVEVDYNDQVAVGQVLARLEDTRLAAQVQITEAALAAAEARVLSAASSLREAKANYESQSALDERGITKRLDLIAYLAARERAEAELAISEAERDTARANLEQSRIDLEKAVIRSPIEGVVLDRSAEAGQIIASSLSTPTLFTLAEDLRRMELRVDIDEADIGRVAVGNRAEFTVDAFDGRSFPAEITQVRFAPETTDGVVTYKAVLSVDNADLLLRPGMTATATITVAEVADALLVPNAALRFSPPVLEETEDSSRGSGLLGLIMPRRPSAPSAGPTEAGHRVWVLRENGPVEVKVTTGGTDARLTEIITGDLAEGDAVITDLVSEN